MVFSAIVCKIEVKVSSSSFIPTTVSGVNCDSHNVRNSDQSAFFKFHLGTPVGSGLLMGFKNVGKWSLPHIKAFPAGSRECLINVDGSWSNKSLSSVLPS